MTANKPQHTTLALLQMRAGADRHENLQRTIDAAAKAARDGAQIICTQELFATEYFCQSEDHAHFKLAEPIPGPITEVFQGIAKEHNVVIVASIFEQRAAGLYHNSAVIIDASGELLGVYRKMHIPDDPQYHEKFYFTPGDLGFRAWDTRYGRLGVLICCSFPPPSPGIPPKKPPRARRNTPHGEPSSKAMPSPMAVLSPP